MKFRLLAGQYICCKPPYGEGHLKGDHTECKEATYKAGEVIESDLDLLSFNGFGVDPKFEKAELHGLLQQQPGESLKEFRKRVDTEMDAEKKKQVEQVHI